MPFSNSQLPTIVPYEEWLRGTSSLVQPRDAMLKALDAQILMYQRNRTTYQFHQLSTAFKHWKESVGPGCEWERHPRNESRLFTLLDHELRGQGDTDVALGAQDFMTPALINSRLGVLYLFGNMTIEDNIFQVLLEGA
ncbi:hypothetical protein, partial [Caballeronia terrestris]|uniref:hypothetical protein n=1 Tax=Caballeronia terrestris TaxID=1226301 RepID=UPI00117E3FFB